MAKIMWLYGLHSHVVTNNICMTENAVIYVVINPIFSTSEMKEKMLSIC